MITKEDLEVIWRDNKLDLLFGVLLIMGMMLIYDNAGCSMPLEENGTTYVYGNCWELVSYKDRQLNNQIMIARDMTFQGTAMDTLAVTVINLTTTSTTSTTSTSCPTTSTVQCPPEKQCPPCTCEICPKCPTCSFEPTKEQIHEALNYKPNFGSSGYQSGGYDAKDYYLELFDIPGRPKFRSRPSPTGWIRRPEDMTFKFTRDVDYCFYVNRTPDVNGRKRWSWNDDSCKSSAIRICHL